MDYGSDVNLLVRARQWRVLRNIVLICWALLIVFHWSASAALNNLGELAQLHFLLDQTYDEQISALRRAQGWFELGKRVNASALRVGNKLERVESLLDRYTASIFAGPTEAELILKKGKLDESAGMYDHAIEDYRQVVTYADAAAVEAGFLLEYANDTGLR